MPDLQPFSLWNRVDAAGPVVVSVPHAGQDYRRIRDLMDVSPTAARLLEDRYADRLVEPVRADGVATVIAHAPRLEIDLNRAPDEIDPAMVGGDHGTGRPLSAKVRAGLGLIPLRLAGVGPLWRSTPTPADIAGRLAAVHAPYHDALAAILSGVSGRWGTALLLDVHSMPPIDGHDAPEIVIGDRFGQSASARLSAAAVWSLKAQGFRVAVNRPYSGGYILARHGCAAGHIHALQVEIDRRLYLDAQFDGCGPGLARMQTAILRLVGDLTTVVLDNRAAAAE